MGEVVGEGDEEDDVSEDGFALFSSGSSDEGSEDLPEGRPTFLETS